LEIVEFVPGPKEHFAHAIRGISGSVAAELAGHVLPLIVPF
jgi:hypothetical protein